MSGFYPYLVASLPMLRFPMKPPFSFDHFLEMCSPLIPEEDHLVLRSLPDPAAYHIGAKRHPVVRQWTMFDTTLRNGLVRIRAGKKHLDPFAFLRPGGSSPAPAVLAAAMNASPLDAEKILDEARWKVLDDLAIGHYFDLDLLVTYAIKLRILERWERIGSADKGALLGQALGR